jgi:hypothetical protein
MKVITKHLALIAFVFLALPTMGDTTQAKNKDPGQHASNHWGVQGEINSYDSVGPALSSWGAQLFVGLLAFFTGGCFGSFASVLIHRIPKGENWISKPSYCPDCGSPIPWWLNLPFIGALLLIIAYQMRTACCHRPMRFKYLYLETIGGCIGAGIAIITFWRFAS